MTDPQQPSTPSGDARMAAALQALPDELARGMSLALWAKLAPDAPAVIAVDGERTFRALNARCNQLARGLRARGLSAGDSVALMCSNRSEFAEVFWAARRTGLRITPVNWHLTGEEAAYIVDDCDAKAFFVEARFDRAAAVIASRASKLTSAVAIGGSLADFVDYEAVLSRESEHDLEDPQLGTQMLYTSGTTGRPKGVYRPQPAVLHPAAVTLANYTPLASVHLATGPLYHAAPLTFSLAIPHACGAAVLMMESWDAERALQLIERYRVTHTHMVPTMFQRLLSLPEATRKRYDVSSLTYVVHGAAPCPAAVKRAVIDWFGPIVYEYYAATEGPGAFVDSATWLAKPGTVGQVDPADQVKILDESGRELTRNQPGLVFLKVPEGGAFHYYKDDEKTRRAYRGDYFTLDDVGYLDDDGYLFLTDRSADLIVSGGVNIYPAEIEAVLLTHPAVADAGVIGVPSDAWGEEVKAVVTLRQGHSPAPQLGAALIEYCRARLAHFKCPRSVDFAGELPRDDSGKLSRRRLRDIYRRTAPGQRS